MPTCGDDDIDEALFRVWQKGDTEALERMWRCFHRRIFTLAVRYCSYFLDRSSACQVATNAFGKAWEELEVGPRLAAGGPGGLPALPPGKARIAWQGAPQLTAYVRTLVLRRCRDELRVEWGHLNRFTEPPGDGDDGGDRFDAMLAGLSATRPDTGRSIGSLTDVERRRPLRRLAGTLAVWEARCCRRPALRALVRAMREYARHCIVEAVTHASSAAPDGCDWRELSFDELIEVAEFEQITTSHAARNEWILTHLGIARGVLDVQWGRLRKLMATCDDEANTTEGSDYNDNHDDAH